MPREPRKLLEDVRKATGLILEFVAGKDLGDYRDDPLLQSAVERQFTIIGEALSQLSKADATIAGQVSEYRRIISFRNLLIHGYGDIDDRIVWGVIKGSVQDLQDEVEALLPGD